LSGVARSTSFGASAPSSASSAKPCTMDQHATEGACAGSPGRNGSPEPPRTVGRALRRRVRQRQPARLAPGPRWFCATSAGSARGYSERIRDMLRIAQVALLRDRLPAPRRPRAHLPGKEAFVATAVSIRERPRNDALAQLVTRRCGERLPSG
jgi:hypothetical protein